MNIIFTSILVILLVLLFAHLVILPLSKKRPIFIKGIEGSFFIFIFFGVMAALIHSLLFVLALVLAAFIYYTRSGIVCGVSLENINSALDRAVIATRAISTKIHNGCEIDNSMLVKVTSFGMRICYIEYRSKTFSKKSELTKEIFRKFLQNYFI